jgi:4-amino-4-deoxy-L-arabinose transferase-like glycosyltransferase
MSKKNKRPTQSSPPLATPVEAPVTAGMSDTTAYTLLFPVVAIALFFRLYQLVQFPPGIWGDEAVNAIDAMHSLRTGDFKVFYPANAGREGLFVWLQAASIGVWGNTLTALRMPSVFIGTLTVFLTFFTTRRLLRFFRRSTDHGSALDANAVGLLAAVFVGVSHWHLNFSRIAFRGILDPLLGLAAIYTLLLLLEKKTYKHAMLAGLATGIGLYGYSSYRIIVIPLLFLVAFSGLRQFGFPTAVARLLPDSRLWTFVLAVVLVAAPLVSTIVEKPDKFFERSQQVSVLAKDNPAGEFRLSAMKALGQFHIEGDTNWRHNLSGEPALPVPLGLSFLAALLAGPALMIGRIPSLRNSSAAKMIGEYTAPAMWLLLVLWLFGGLLPAALTFDGRPHFLRSISSIPPTYILTAIGCFAALHLLSRMLPRRVAAAGVLLLAVLLPAYAIRTTWHSYFHEWATHPAAADYFMMDTARIAHRVATLPDASKKFVVVGERGKSDKSKAWSAQPLVYLTHTETAEARTAKNFTYTGLDMLEQLSFSDEECYFILIDIKDEDKDEVNTAIAKIAPRAAIIR